MSDERKKVYGPNGKIENERTSSTAKKPITKTQTKLARSGAEGEISDILDYFILIKTARREATQCLRARGFLFGRISADDWISHYCPPL